MASASIAFVDEVRPLLESAQTPGVVAVGAAQEFQSVTAGYGAACRPPWLSPTLNHYRSVARSLLLDGLRRSLIG